MTNYSLLCVCLFVGLSTHLLLFIPDFSEDEDDVCPSPEEYAWR
jgi:hypothetical protein